jgi:anti-sigma factor RsiW
MKCEEALERLDDYVDGALPEAEFQEIELHIAGCPACRAAEEGLRDLLARASSLPREMRPPRDLWPAIRERIDPPRAIAPRPERSGARWWTLGSLAAAAAVVVALVSTLTSVGPSPAPQAGATGVAQPAGTGSAAAPMQQAETEYMRATGQLMDVLNARRGSMSPETQASVNKNLQAIDEALGALREALDKDPSNRQLNKMLASTQQKKLNLLLRLIRLSSQI